MESSFCDLVRSYTAVTKAIKSIRPIRTFHAHPLSFTLPAVEWNSRMTRLCSRKDKIQINETVNGLLLSSTLCAYASWLTSHRAWMIRTRTVLRIHYQGNKLCQLKGTAFNKVHTVAFSRAFKVIPFQSSMKLIHILGWVSYWRYYLVVGSASKHEEQIHFFGEHN